MHKYTFVPIVFWRVKRRVIARNAVTRESAADRATLTIHAVVR
jgi:hypothetical protein